MYFQFIRYRKIFYLFSATLVILAIASIFVFGLRLGIDFTGGSSLSVTYKNNPPSFKAINEKLKDLDLGEIILQKTGDRGIILKAKTFKQNDKEILKRLESLGEIEQDSVSFRAIGPAVGQELKRKTNIVVLLALLAILIYIAFSFRKVARPVNSSVYGTAGLIALFHDVLIPLGILVVLGKYYQVELSIPIITAFLTIFGYSVNDSVVVFDRIRENLLKSRGTSFDITVEKSLNQTLARSFNTSLTTLIVLFAIFLFGGETLKYFSLTLILGISFGTYSSIFLASPLLVSYWQFKSNKKAKVTK
ncbi:protein translocase subunit SecF [bacterium]|nr:protein translocase subunit SecF [bacterium]